MKKSFFERRSDKRTYAIECKSVRLVGIKYIKGKHFFED